MRRRGWRDLADLLARASEPQPDTGCRLWARGRSRGYGSTYFDGRIVQAHRMALTLAFGWDPNVYFDLPTHIQCRHLCHTPPCIEPSHLAWGSRRSNARDSIAVGLHPTAWLNGTCHKGHDVTDENAVYVDVRGARHCRECGHESSDEARYERADDGYDPNDIRFDPIER